jgi:hypothetical protein
MDAMISGTTLAKVAHHNISVILNEEAIIITFIIE